MKTYEAIVIGASAGGTKALSSILAGLPPTFPLPIIIVLHRYYDEDSLLIDQFRKTSKMKVLETADKDKITKGCIYFAPSDYHVLIEEDKTFALSYDPTVNYARPSVDLLFDSASFVYEDNLIAIVLTGANMDGANGLANVKKQGGLSIVQDPRSAENKVMPNCAIELVKPDHIFNLDEIRSFLSNLKL
ncbi:MAG: chemotaxis protein CheB [Oligoflexales bacterium]